MQSIVFPVSLEPMISNPFEAAEAAGRALRDIAAAPPVAVVLGSGLGAFSRELEDAKRIPYSRLPHFPQVSVVGHAGEIAVGRLPGGGPAVVALSGRVHLYEGHHPSIVVHPLRSLARWGVKALVLTNAAGAINPDMSPGQLMLIEDHINLSGSNPLTGENDDRLGVRFPDMSSLYDSELSSCFIKAAETMKFELKRGTYVGLLGPSYETPAEIKMLGRMGADAVGMSTVCEAIAARHCGLKVAGISCLTNHAAGLNKAPLSHHEVKETAALVERSFIELLKLGLTDICSTLTA